MDEQLALIAAIVATPGEDAPRLVYADWLDDRGGPGDADRAAFVRVQCELFGLRHKRLTNSDGSPRKDCWFDCRGCLLERRERGLMSDLRDRLRAELPDPEPRWAFYLSHQGEGFADGWTFWMSRGFADSLTLPAADWLAHADALAWRPGLTDECPECGGKATSYPRTVCTECGKEVEGKVNWVQGNRRTSFACPSHGWRSGQGVRYEPHCPHCSGTGRVPRPCPPTAQPIEKVALTTFLPMEERFSPDGFAEWRIAGRSGMWASDEQRHHDRDRRPIAEILLAAEWPWIEFGVATVATQRTHFDPAAEAAARA